MAELGSKRDVTVVIGGRSVMLTKDAFVITTNTSGFTLRWKHNYRAIRTFIIHPDKVVDGTIKTVNGWIPYEERLLEEAKQCRDDFIEVFNRWEEPEVADQKRVRDVGVLVPDNYRCDNQGFISRIVHNCLMIGGKYEEAGKKVINEGGRNVLQSYSGNGNRMD